MTSSYPDNVTPLFGGPRQKAPRRVADEAGPRDIRPRKTGPDATGQGPRRGEKLDQNIAHFVRVLRRAGLRIGSAATLQAVQGIAHCLRTGLQCGIGRPCNWCL